MNGVKGVMIAIGITGLAVGGSAVAQPSAIPPDVAAKVRALGPVLNDEVRASARSAYAPLQPKIGPEILVKADLSYGPDERHKLDVFAPTEKPPQPAQWPAGAQDVGAAAKWVRTNISAYNGDPNRIVLMGHSAGASHAAGYLFHKQLQPANGDDGVIMILTQANLFPEFPPFPGTPQNPSGYTDVRSDLQKEAAGFGRPVVLVHGDSHFFRVDKPLSPRPVRGTAVAPALEHFTRVETFGSPYHHWVHVTMDPSDPNVFTFRPRLVAANLGPQQ